VNRDFFMGTSWLKHARKFYFCAVRGTVGLRRGPVSHETVLPLAFKLIKVAEGHWRKLNGFAHLAKVITGVRFADGVELRDDSPAQAISAAA
jgi:hypothetical protein